MAAPRGDVSVSVIPSSAQNISAMMGGMTSYLRNFTRDMLFQEAALCANAFLMFSPPIPKGGGFSNSMDAKRAGERAVDLDVRSFVVPKDKSAMAIAADPNREMSAFMEWRSKPLTGKVGYILAKIHSDENAERAFQKAQNLAGRFPYQERILKDESQLKEVHNYMRQRYKGRIRNGKGPPANVKAKPFVLEKAKINRYIKERQKRVGFLNSGWWNVITKIPAVRIRGADRFAGRQNVPAWVKRHGNSLGTFTNGVGQSVTALSFVQIQNLIGDIHGVATTARAKSKVIEYRKNQIALRPWQRFIDQACLVSNRGQRPT
jgi:hypothetical protein